MMTSVLLLVFLFPAFLAVDSLLLRNRRGLFPFFGFGLLSSALLYFSQQPSQLLFRWFNSLGMFEFFRGLSPVF